MKRTVKQSKTDIAKIPRCKSAAEMRKALGLKRPDAYKIHKLLNLKADQSLGDKR